ncbi:MAG: PKD domain-containing protein [Candidatus Omnitrophica bacterium]|jgi:tetratricopeptide (TPR) repeat protein|nr:PKD domain-containing protein [Candidatus Omnitrophota bacterium]
MKKFIFILILLLYIFIIPANASIWLKGWQYRKTLKIEGTQDNYPVQKITVFQFTGKAKKNGSDIRVINSKGIEVPYRLISAGPGNYYQICFPVNENIYYLFYGNPFAQKIKYSFIPHRGLFLQVYKRQGFYANTWKSAEKIIQQSIKGKCFGKSLWPKVWDANNPFGPDENFIRIYKGYFYIKKNVHISFGTSSGGPSFLIIDNKLTASWPGWHGAEPFIQPSHSGNIDLKPGLHYFVYYQLARPWQTIAVAAIKMPGEKKFHVIPESFFLPVEKIKVIQTEKKDSAFSVEFSWENTFYLLRESFQLITFKFTPEVFGNLKDIKEYYWNFGDGQTSRNKKPNHTYIKSGLYPVRLSIITKQEKIYSNTLLVNVSQNYAKIYIPSENGYQYLKEFKKYNFKKLSVDKLFILAEIFESYSDLTDAFSCYKILLKHTLNYSERQNVSLLAASLAIKTKKFAQAENIYKSLLKIKDYPEVKLKLSKLYFLENKLTLAETGFKEILRTKNISKNIKNSSEIGLGDIYRQEGNKQKAMEEYKKVSGITLDYEKTSVYSQEVLYYIKDKDFVMAFHTLNIWAETIPLAKMEGLWSVLFARACFDAKEYHKGLREINTFTKISSIHNPYMVWILFIKAETYKKLENYQEAKYYYRKVIDLFPGSMLSIIAEKEVSSFH